METSEMQQRLDEAIQKYFSIQPGGGKSLSGWGAAELLINCFLIGFDVGRGELGDAFDRAISTHFTDAYTPEALALRLLGRTLAKSLKQFLQAIQTRNNKAEIQPLKAFMTAPTSEHYLDWATFATLLTKDFFRDPGESPLCKLVSNWLAQWQCYHFPNESPIDAYYPYWFSQALYDEFIDNENYKKLTQQLRIADDVLLTTANACNEWKAYHETLIGLVDEELPWFDFVKLKVKDLFFEEQQLRLWLPRPGGKDSEHKPDEENRWEDNDALCKLEAVVAERKSCALVSAPSGYGCSILAKMLCKTLAKKGERVLYVSMDATTSTDAIDALLEQEFATGVGRPFSPNSLELQGPAVLIFDDLNKMVSSHTDFYARLNSYLIRAKRRNNSISVLLFLPQRTRETAYSILKPPQELRFELQGLTTPVLRERWIDTYATAAGKDATVLKKLMQRSKYIAQQMEHPAVCSLMAHLYCGADENTELPTLTRSKKRLLNLLPQFQKRIFLDNGFRSIDSDPDLAQRKFKNALRMVAHGIWQNNGITSEQFKELARDYMSDDATQKMESLFIFRKEVVKEGRNEIEKTFFAFGFMHDCCCASYLVNEFLRYDKNYDREKCLKAFAGQPPTEGIVTRLAEYCEVNPKPNEYPQWQQKLAELLRERLEEGWSFPEDSSEIKLKEYEAHASNADLCLLAVLSVLGHITQTCADIKWTDDAQNGKPWVNRWLHGLFGGIGHDQWPPQGLRYFNWLQFPKGTPLDTCFCCLENFKGMKPEHFRWEYPTDAKRYIDENKNAIIHIGKQLRFARIIKENDEQDAAFALYQLRTLMMKRAHRLPVLLDNFDNLHLKTDCLKKLLDDLAALYRKPQPKIECPDSFMLHTDWDVLDKLLQRLLNNAERFGIDGLPIRVKVKELDSAVTISVINYAISVDSREVDYLHLYRYRGKNAKRLYGSGEGLWYCQQAARALGGDCKIAYDKIKGLEYDLAALATYGFNPEKKHATQDKYRENNGDKKANAFEWEKADQAFANLQNALGEKDYDFLVNEYGLQNQQLGQNFKYGPFYAAERFVLPATAKYTARLTLNMKIPRGETV